MKRSNYLVALGFVFVIANLIVVSAHSMDVFRVQVDEYGAVHIDHETSEIYGTFPPPGPWTGEMVIEQYEVECCGFPLPVYPSGDTATMGEIFVTISLKYFGMAVPSPSEPPLNDIISCEVDMTGIEPLFYFGNPIPASNVTFLVTVVAIKQGDPVSMEASTFGNIKSTFR